MIQGHSVFIGIDLDSFDKYSSRKTVDNQHRLKIVYCGSLDKSYDIKLVIDALALLEYPPLFVVLGDGSLRNEFESYAKIKKLRLNF